MQLKNERLIGPHEGQEFDLIKRGDKTLAYFGEDSVSMNEKYQKAKELGLDELEFYFDPIEVDENIILPRHKAVIFYVTGYEQKAKRLEKLLIEAISLFRVSSKSKYLAGEREIGELLGYSKKQIDAYIDFQDDLLTKIAEKKLRNDLNACGVIR
ncbi:hypothetical protein [Marinomonas polaris]|jgi:hypothetical protein|uniref:hypothetical protein n=1 Tax=Marinomonas polaris TaxID=293552 RepID=UPI003F954777